MTHHTTIKVRGYHVDVNGHVNNARYLEYLEAARWEFLEDNGLADAVISGTSALVVTNINIDYRRPAVLGDVVDVETTLVALRSRSGTMDQIVRAGSDICARATVTFMVYDRHRQAAMRIQGALHDRLAQLLVPA